MNIKHLLAAAATALGASTTVAAEATSDDWTKFSNVTLPQSRSRAEVLAELEIYRRSGLADLERGEAPDFFSHQHRAASARYAAMRSSLQFASLVQSIAQRRGETVNVATAATAR